MFARLLLSIPRLLSARFEQDMDKPLATDVLKTKVKISLFTLLFTVTVYFYCSWYLLFCTYIYIYIDKV